MNKPEKQSSKQKAIIHKAEVLAQEVLSGLYPDTRTLWNDRIERATGLHYSFTPPPSINEPEVEQTPETEPAKQTLFEFSINLDTLRNIMKVIKG